MNLGVLREYDALWMLVPVVLGFVIGLLLTIEPDDDRKGGKS